MWPITPGGFVSIVQKAEDVADDTLTVRARDHRSLVNFCRQADIPKKRISEETVTDYPFRLVATREEVERAMMTAVDEIRYANFKDEAKRVRGGVFVKFLSSVWVDGLSLTPPAVAKRANESLKRRQRSLWGDRDLPTQDVGDMTNDEWLDYCRAEFGVDEED